MIWCFVVKPREIRIGYWRHSFFINFYTFNKEKIRRHLHKCANFCSTFQFPNKLSFSIIYFVHDRLDVLAVTCQLQQLTHVMNILLINFSSYSAVYNSLCIQKMPLCIFVNLFFTPFIKDCQSFIYFTAKHK